MTRRLRSEKCPRCRLPPPLCLCAQLTPWPARTHLVVVIHVKEAARPSNSGHLLPLLLRDARVIVRGEADTLPTPMPAGLPTPVAVLFPAAGALPLDALPEPSRPRTLVLPDGNWRQARRAVQRTPGLVGLPIVCLPAGPPPRHRLRGHPEDDHLSTLEAAARALGVLEGPAVQAHLEAAWDAFVAAVERLREGGI